MKMKNKTKALLLAVSAALALSGCQATRVNSYTGEEETSSATTGAILGCATGAIIGGVIKGGKGAALGCAAGAYPMMSFLCNNTFSVKADCYLCFSGNLTWGWCTHVQHSKHHPNF